MEQSVEFFLTLRKYHNQITLLYQLVYGAGNFLLQGLNVFWYASLNAYVSATQ